MQSAAKQLPIPDAQNPDHPQSIAFWQKVVATCQVTAIRILDDMVAVNFQQGEQDSIPLPVCVWYFWSRLATLVMAEFTMQRGVAEADLRAAVTLAKELKVNLEWLIGSVERRDNDKEKDEIKAMHDEIMVALKQRPHYGTISDMSYGGLVPEPSRIVLAGV